MIIKKFQAQTETDAIMLAKQELGKDAIVMNVKNIKPRGIYKLFKKAMVEITAAVDDNIVYHNEKTFSKVNETPDKAKEESFFSQPISKTKSEKEEKKGITAIEERLNHLQFLLEEQMKEKAEGNKEGGEKTIQEETSPCIQLIYNQLVNNEVDEKYAGQILSEIEKSINKDSTIDNVLASVYQKIILKLGQSKTIDLLENKTKFVFFIGPTGVGKTTTIAKIAAGFKLVKDIKIAFVTADTYRIAAVEQLKIYAGILGIPIRVVYTEDEMREIKKDFEEYDLVFVDTAGRSHKSREQRDDVERILSTIPEEEREIYLVLSATTKYKDLIKITDAYQKITDYNVIFTKLDETDCLGNLLNIRMLTGASLSYAAWGQNVPEDIGKMDAQDIAKQLLGGND